MSSLEVRSLVKKLGGHTVVEDVSFRIEDGEFFVLLGTSGSGKSTILRLICGLETPDSGQVFLDGRDVTRLSPRDRNLGMVFQDYGLYPNMNVYQNIAYGLEARRVAKNEIEQRVKSAATMIGLGEMLGRSIVDLSGGEQQRVAVARALAKDADAYLFDEPLSNLDPKLRYQARRDILTLHREKRKPSLYVTHDQTEAFAMADRIAIMSRGKLQQVATADTILANPANINVAQFTGTPSMNLIEGQVLHNGNAYEVILDGFKITLPERWNPILSGYNKSSVITGFRPESVLLAESAAADDQMQTFKGHAGNILRKPAAEHPDEFWDEIIEINLSAPFILAREFGKEMVARNSGKIIFTASLLTFQGGITVPGYASSKAGIGSLTKALANEWAGKGVNVNAIAPGYIATDNTAALQKDEVRNASILSRIPAGRWGNTEDFMGATVFLASSASDYVHGTILTVDGGWMGR